MTSRCIKTHSVINQDKALSEICNKRKCFNRCLTLGNQKAEWRLWPTGRSKTTWTLGSFSIICKTLNLSGRCQTLTLRQNKDKCQGLTQSDKETSRTSNCKSRLPSLPQKKYTLKRSIVIELKKHFQSLSTSWTNLAKWDASIMSETLICVENTTHSWIQFLMNFGTETN